MHFVSEWSLFDSAFGLPLHPLAVHVVVVLVPLAALGAVVMVVSRRLARRYGGLIVVAGVASFIASIVAKEAGVSLASRVGVTAQHAQLGNAVPILALILACAAVTIVPRVLPLVLLSRIALPAWVLAWLAYVPVAVLAALLALEVLVEEGRPAVSAANPALLAIVPTLAIAALTRSLIATAVSGVGLYWLLL